MLVLAMAVKAGAAAAQPAPPAQPAKPASPAKPAYTVSVTKDPALFLSLTAQDAKLSDVAADVAKRLNAKVIVGPSLKDQRVTAQFQGTPLEPAMLAIAPRVYVDYELRSGVDPVPLGIYLLGHDDPMPSVSAVVQGTTQGILFSGNTEDTGQPAPDAPLRITMARGRLSLFAKEQMLLVVVMSVADTLGVPAEIKYETRETINANIKETTAIEEAIAGLSEHVRVYYRADANRLEKAILRIVLAPPAGK